MISPVAFADCFLLCWWWWWYGRRRYLVSVSLGGIILKSSWGCVVRSKTSPLCWLVGSCWFVMRSPTHSQLRGTLVGIGKTPNTATEAAGGRWSVGVLSGFLAFSYGRRPVTKSTPRALIFVSPCH